MSEAEKTGETDLDIDELIELVAGASNLGKHGPNLGRITKITKAPDFVDVQPLLAKIIQGQPRLNPELQDVPVAWPSTTAGRLTFPLAVGDKVELVPLAGDLTSWITSEAETPSANGRSQSLSDVVAVVQAPSSKANPSPSESYSAAAVVLYAATMLLLGDNTATEFVALATKTLTEIQTIRDHVDGHQHPETGGTTGVPTVLLGPDPLPPDTVAAEKVKAK
jgi:hypothetical protein